MKYRIVPNEPASLLFEIGEDSGVIRTAAILYEYQAAKYDVSNCLPCQ